MQELLGILFDENEEILVARGYIDLNLTGVFLCTQICMSEVLFSTEVQNFKHSLNQDSISRIFWKAVTYKNKINYLEIWAKLVRHDW